MARDFKIELDNVEMINGSDDLLKDTKVTKVILTGENKLNSLNSTFENCTELTSIEGEINLDGISDMTEMALNTTVDEIKVTNPTEENIQANDSLNQIGNVKIGGTKYSKGGVQDVVGSLEWNAENFTYEDAILDNVYTNSSSIEESKNITISNTLEQKATSIEITGQTYENLVNGKATENLLDEMSMQQTEGKPTQFTPHMEQPICLEYIEGETYQNLIEGKGEYKLTDTFSTTWTESNNCIENAPNIIEIPEIFGNTVQGFANCITTDQIVTSLVNTINTGATSYSKRYMPNNSGGYVKVSDATLSITDFSLLTDECFIQLKPNTTYSYRSMRVNSNQVPGMSLYSPSKSLGGIGSGNTFTTDNTGKVIMYPSGCQDGQIGMKLVEGEYDLGVYPWDFDLSYIQSVGDLYVNESGEPILDEGGNEQYKLEIISHGYVTDSSNSRSIVQNLFLSSSETFTNITVYAGTPLKAYFQCIAKMDLSKSKTGYFCTFVQGGANSIKYYSTDHSLKFLYENKEYFLGIINHNEPFSITIKQVNSDTSLLVYFNGIEKVRITSTIFGHGNFVAFNSRYHTGIGEGCGSMNIIYAQCSKNIVGYVGIDEDDWNNINKWNKTTILMPQPLRKGGYERYSPTNPNNNLDKPLIDKLVCENGKYIMKIKVFETTVKESFKSNLANGTVWWKLLQTFPSNVTDARGYSNIPDMEITYHGGNLYARVPKSKFPTIEEANSYVPINFVTNYSYSTFADKMTIHEEVIEVEPLEAISLETYSPKTYISTNTEIQPSKMNITNKRNVFLPLGLQANKDYTLQLDSVGKDDKPITVNLGGSEITTQPVNDTSKHHKVVVRTPSTLTTDKLDLSGEGVVVNDVMLFEGGSNEIKQDVEYVEGIESIGKYTITKNKFPNNIVFTKDRTLLNDGTIYGGTTTDYATEDYILCNLDVNKVYSISSPFTYKKVAFYDESKKFISIINTNTNTYLNGFSIPSNAKYYRVSVNNSAGKEIKIQIEEGNTHTSYEEYFEGGRYKIDILTTNGVKNLVNTNPNNWVVKDSDTVIIKSSIKVNKGKTYTVFNSMGQWVAVYESDWNGNQYNLIRQDNGGNWSFVATSEYIKVSLWNVSYVSDKLSQPHNMNVRIFEGYNDYGYNGYEERKLSTQSILLPQPLNKIGELKDKFYWDDNKGHYCIEQRVDKINIADYNWWRLDSSSNGYDTFILSSFNNNTLYSPTIWGGKIIVSDEAIIILDAVHLRMKYPSNKFEGDVEKFKDYCLLNGVYALMQRYGENKILTIDLPHLNKKYSVDTYMPTTYLECTNSPMQPSKLLLKSDTIRYDSIIKPNTLYTIQFNCLKETIAISTLNLGGTIIEVVPTIGLNHFTITTSNTLTSNELSIIDSDSRFIDVIVNEGEMNQYPKYFDGVQSVGELQDDCTYKIEVLSRCQLVNANSFVSGRLDRGILGYQNDSTVTINGEDIECVTSSDWRGCVSGFAKINPNTEYSFKYNIVSDGVDVIPCPHFYTKDKTYISDLYNQSTFTSPIDAEYVRIYFACGVVGSFIIKDFDFSRKMDISIISNSPLAKGDKLYWNKSNKRYEIDRGGSVEVPTVSGDVIDLPRLYQREDTTISISTDNIEPSKIDISYKDIR